jgi:hypothetical protein
MGDSPRSDAVFARLVPRSASLSDLVAAVTAQANQHSTALIAQKATAQRLEVIEGTVSELDSKFDRHVADVALDRARRGHELKRLGAFLTFAGALLASCVTAGVNYATRPPPASPAVVAPPSAFDRAINACNAIPDAPARGKCVVDVAVANAR